MKKGRCLQIFFVMILIFLWFFSDLPRVFNFSSKIREIEAVTTTVFATSNSADGALEGWTNPTYAYTDDGTNFTTRVGTVKNTWYGTLYGFDLSGIPDGSTINSVTITAEWKNSAADTTGPVLSVGAQLGGSEISTATSDTTGQTTFELVNNSPIGLTTANLKTTGVSGFWAILRFRRTDNTATHTASVDYVKVLVDYTAVTAPTVTTQAVGSVESTTATGNGNITNTGGQNANAWGVCYRTTSGCTTADSVAAGSGTGGTGAFTASMVGLSSGTTYYIKAYATNPGGTGYGNEVNILTKPAAPTNVAATDGTNADKVTITWTKSTGATNYHVWRDSTDLGATGDVATFDDTGAGAPSITAGSTVASDGTSTSQVDLSLSGASTNNGTTHTYKVVASNATGNSVDSATNTGYRGVGSLTYQWQRSAADSDATYSDISGATSATYSDTGGAFDGSGRYYKCVLSATGVAGQTSSSDRGFVAVISVEISANGVISYGGISFNTSKSTLQLGTSPTARNNGNVAEDFTIKTSAATGGVGWTLGTITGSNIFVYEFSVNNGTNWTKFTTADTYVGPPAPATNIAVNGTQNFDLRLTTPTFSDAVEKTITVTILATQH